MAATTRQPQRLAEQRFAKTGRGGFSQHFVEQIFLVIAVAHFSIRPERRLSVCGGFGTVSIQPPFPSFVVHPRFRGRTGGQSIFVRPVSVHRATVISNCVPATRVTFRQLRRHSKRCLQYPVSYTHLTLPT